MWVLKKAKNWSKKRKRKRKTMDSEGARTACGYCHHCQKSACSNINPFPSMPFPIQPNAPPLPPQEYENEFSEISQGPMVCGPSTSYQHYMDSDLAYGVPIWPGMQQPEWTTGLCHCEADMPTCLSGFLCPCILFGKLAEEMDGGLTSGITASVVWYLLQQTACFGCVYSFGFRRKLRERYNLPEKPLPDWLVHCFCWSCAFCQEYRELNMRKMAGEALLGRPIMAPPQSQSMIY